MIWCVEKDVSILHIRKLEGGLEHQALSEANVLVLPLLFSLWALRGCVK